MGIGDWGLGIGDWGLGLLFDFLRFGFDQVRHLRLIFHRQNFTERLVEFRLIRRKISRLFEQRPDRHANDHSAKKHDHVEAVTFKKLLHLFAKLFFGFHSFPSNEKGVCTGYCFLHKHLLFKREIAYFLMEKNASLPRYCATSSSSSSMRSS